MIENLIEAFLLFPEYSENTKAARNKNFLAWQVRIEAKY